MNKIEIPKHYHGWIIGILVFLALVGSIFILVDDYGLSWDEYSLEIYANQTLEVVEGDIAPDELEGILRYYGPVTVTTAEIIGRIVSTGIPQIQKSDARHTFYVVIFVTSLPFLFFLLNRVVSSRAAIFGTLLYATQPVIWGHAFINPKDIPFASLFIITIETGFRAWGSYQSTDQKSQNLEKKTHPPVTIKDQWNNEGRRTQFAVFGLGCLAMLAIIERSWLHYLQGIGSRLITQAYEGNAPAVFQTFFNRVAQDTFKTDLTIYIEKFESAYFWLTLITVAVLLLLCFFLLRRIFRQSKWEPFERIGIVAFICGLTISTRIFGIYVGLLLSLYALLVRRNKAIPSLLLFWGISLLVMYFTWPYLWEAPIDNFIASLKEMFDFYWPGNVLYSGQFLPTEELPWFTVPHLLSIQLTIPVILLSILGLPRIIKSWKSSQNKNKWIVLIAWLCVPILAAMFSTTKTYDNFRQLIFALPPLFAISAYGFDLVLSRLENLWGQAALISILIFPGIIGILQLHPYEYIYYNQFIGGIAGAKGSYEMDYWCISYRESIEYLNSNAPEGAVIGVNKTTDQVTPFSRTDFIIVAIMSQDDLQVHMPDYIIACGRWGEPGSLPGYNIIHRVSANGVDLSYIYQIDS